MEENDNNSIGDFRHFLDVSEKSTVTTKIGHQGMSKETLNAKMTSNAPVREKNTIKIKAGVTTIVILAVFLIYLIFNSETKSQIKSPDGYRIIYPENSPPRLEKIN